MESAKLEAEALLSEPQLRRHRTVRVYLAPTPFCAGKQREVLRLQAAVCHKSTQDATDAVGALSARTAEADKAHAADAARLLERQAGLKDLLARHAAAQKASDEAAAEVRARPSLLTLPLVPPRAVCTRHLCLFHFL